MIFYLILSSVIEQMFDTKKFIAFIAFNDRYREMFFDLAESKGIDSHWDTYHVLADEEYVPQTEEKIMEEIYLAEIKGNEENERLYNSSVEDFQANLSKKIKKSLKKS